MICPKCGTVNGDLNEFCANCGEPFAAGKAAAKKSAAKPEGAHAKKSAAPKKPSVTVKPKKTVSAKEAPETDGADAELCDGDILAEALSHPDVSESFALQKKTLRGYSVPAAPVSVADPTRPAAPNPAPAAYSPPQSLNGDKNWAGMAAFILGIMAMCSLITVIFSVPLGVLAVVFGIIGLKGDKRDLSLIGLILGGVTLLLLLLMAGLLAALIGSASSFASSFDFGDVFPDPYYYY